jgi:AcrR family transcriptional regulator
MPHKAPEQIGTRTNDHQRRILDAAAEIFLEKGFVETSTADIARRAKVSKRELYSNFSDKRDILAAVIIGLQSRIHADANVSWSSTGDLRTVLTRAGTQILQFVNSDIFGRLLRIVAAESFRDPVSAQKFYLLGPSAGREDTAAFLKRHIKEGHLRKADPLEAADDLLDLLVSSRYITAVVLGQRENGLRPASHVKHAVDVFLNYYAMEKEDEQGSRKRPAKLQGTARSNGKPPARKHAASSVSTR